MYKKWTAFVQDTRSQTIHISDNVNKRYVQSINQFDLYEIKGEREGGGCFYPTQVLGGD